MWRRVEPSAVILMVNNREMGDQPSGFESEFRRRLIFRTILTEADVRSPRDMFGRLPSATILLSPFRYLRMAPRSELLRESPRRNLVLVILCRAVGKPNLV